ncbi:MAG TPA: alpha/beta hydrolase [Thermoanaerobaculia bacterium]|jgi:acetyl esterase/lipase
MTRSILLVALLGFATAALGGTFTTYSALEYASPEGERLLLDLRVPDGAGPHPVILYLHSGAWVTGDRTGGPALRQASRGYAVASIDYRLAPDSIWPSQIEDAKAAIRWLRANAARFHLDPNRIGVFGASAGGHLAAVLGTSGGVDALEGLNEGNPQFSSRVRAVVDFYGPTDLLKLDEQKPACSSFLDGNAAFMPPSLLMGCSIQQCAEQTRTASPMSYITRDDPPFLILHGQRDCLVPWQQSVLLDQALRAAGVRSQLVLIPEGEHGGSAFDAPSYRKMVDDFLDQNLKAPAAAKRRAARH